MGIGRLSDDFINLTTQLMMAREKSEIIRIAADFNTTIGRLIEAEKNGSGVKPTTKAVTTVLKFTKQEISRMATTFKKEFILNGLAARVTKRESGKNSYCYEIRYRSNGYNITASSTDLAEAKKKFLEKTTPGEIGKYYNGNLSTIRQGVPTNFESFTLYYFEKFRLRDVAEKTYRNDKNRLKNHILPKLGKFEIKKITPQDCQEIIDNLMRCDKCKTAVEVYNILSCIFKNAIAHGIMEKSPLSIVSKPTYDQENGIALSLEEEYTLLNALNGSKFQVSIAIALFCGLRPNELSTVVLDGDFIKAVNSKRHKKDKSKIEYKWIPITAKLRPYVCNGIPPVTNLNAVRKCFTSILPNHILYDCRTTFYSRCKECKVDQRALDEYMGHSLGKIGNAYTDLSKEFLWQEGLKINY